MVRIFQSITTKICLLILIIETVLLSLLGVYYVNRFWHEIDTRVAEKMAMPAALMSQRALNFDSVKDFSVLEDLLHEKVEDAFITRKDGKIFYSADSKRIGLHYSVFLKGKEPVHMLDDLSDDLLFSYSTARGNFRAILSPITINDRLLGYFYVEIQSDRIQKRKNTILAVFLAGSFATLFLTTLLEAYFVRNLIVPRLQNTLSTLRKVEDGDLSDRILKNGDPDELGVLIGQVNSMISTIEKNTKDLQLLNQSARSLPQVATKEEIVDTVIETFAHYLSVSFSDEEMVDIATLIAKLPAESKGVDKLFDLLEKFGLDSSDSSAREFIFPLHELIVSAINRLDSLIEIKNAEEKYRTLFDTAVEGIFRTSAEGQVLVANPALADLMGYASPDDMIANCYDVGQLHYDNPDDRKQFVEMLLHDGTVNDFEVRMLRTNGSVFYGSITAHTITDDGELVAIEGGIVDISERKMREQAERDKQVAEAANEVKSEMLLTLEAKNAKMSRTLDELRTTQMQLLQSEKMATVGLTAGGVAHDLNNILAGVIGYPELLLMKLPEDSEIRSPLEAIVTSGKRAAAVVEDLLTLSRSAMRTLVVISVNRLVKEYFQSTELNKMMGSHPGIKIYSELEEDLANVNCSPAHIHKVIMNLIVNAVESIPEKGEVKITTANRELTLSDDVRTSFDSFVPGKYVLIEVSDTGEGIAENDLQHIFEPFYSKKVMGRSGTGLGLTVVWNSVYEHGGAVTVGSSDSGTIFSVYLPASEKELEEQSRHKPATVSKVDGNILIVDDEPLQLDVAKKMLTYAGFKANTVRSGEQAVEYLKDHQVDLVLLDMLMPPGMNGLETYRKILERNPNQKAIIVSGYSANEDIQKVLELGAGSFVKKPYTFEQLVLAVREELEKR